MMAVLDHPRHPRRQAILVLLASVAFVGTLLSAYQEMEEAQEIERMLAMPYYRNLALLDEYTTEDRCWDLMKKAKIKKKKYKKAEKKKKGVDMGKATPAQKAQWKALNCEKELSLFQPKVLGYNDTLREDVSQSTMALEHQQAQCDMTKAVIVHLRERGVRFAAGFGNLLAIVRNGVAVVPWDDDIDLVVDDRAGDFMKKMTAGLKSVSKDAVKGPKYGLKYAWELPGGYILYYKTSGNRWKMHPKGRGYPLLDLWPYKKKPDAPEMNWFSPKILQNGHIHKFEKPNSWYGSLTKTMTVPFSVDIPDLIEFSVPDDVLAAVVDDYGDDALTQCKVSFVHRGCTYSKAECAQAERSRMQHLNFPCVLLPESLHGTTLVREKGKIPRENVEEA